MWNGHAEILGPESHHRRAPTEQIILLFKVLDATYRKTERLHVILEVDWECVKVSSYET